MKAKWIKAEISNYYKCSNCGAYNSFPFYDKYCYECGAEMEKLSYIHKAFEESEK